MLTEASQPQPERSSPGSLCHSALDGWCSRQLKHLDPCPCVGGQIQGLTRDGDNTLPQSYFPSLELSCLLIMVINKSDISDHYVDPIHHHPLLNKSVDSSCSMGQRQEAGQGCSGKQVLKAVDPNLLRYRP